MSDVKKLGDLQLSILRILWTHGEATVNQVHRDLQGERPLAPTTVATMLTKMEKKGLVGHRKDGRRFIYRPLVRENEAKRSMVGDLVDRVFQGDTAAALNHLIRESEIDVEELDKLQRLIREKMKSSQAEEDES